MPDLAPIGFVSRRQPFLDAIKLAQKDEEFEARRYAFRTREETLTEHMVEQQESVGLKRFRAYEEILENGFGREWRRETFQREFHDRCSCALSSLLLGEDWEQDGPDLCRSRGWTKVCKQVIGKAPRRFGKSAAVAMMVAGLAEVFSIRYPVSHEFTIAIFSTGRRASSNLKDYCFQFLVRRGLSEHIVKHNQETIWIRQSDDKDGPVVKVFFYPSNAKISYSLYFIFTGIAWRAPRREPLSLSLFF